MARTFRFYEKKRGHRRTGSRRLASFGELAFSGAMTLAGIIGLTLMIAQWIVPDWRANREFIETRCQVLDRRIVAVEGEGGPLFRPELHIEYEIDGRPFRAWTYDIQRSVFSSAEGAATALEPFAGTSGGDRAKRTDVVCWYDPLDPHIVVVNRGYSWWIWVALLAPAAFLAAGIGGLVYIWLHWGRSVEHAAALARRVQDGELFRGKNRREYPFVPDGDDIHNSPGTHLKFRLPIANSPGWALVTALVASIFWNGLVGTWIAFAVAGHRRGQPDWFQTLFLVPFALIGVGLIIWFVRQLLVTTGVGPTLAEVSDHPLLPSRGYQIFVSQTGWLRVERFDVSLLCHEEATFRQGT
ncbi:MAG: DUF3592 domain-containing protein, partial [Planctomycetota bacterium]